VLSADSVTVYTNEAAWQHAATNGGTNPLATVSFDASAWTQTVTYENTYTTYSDVTSASDGTTVTFQNSGDALHVIQPVLANDSLSDGIEAYGDSDRWSFGQPIYAFGAYYNLTPAQCDPTVDSCPVPEVILADVALGATEDGFGASSQTNRFPI